MDAPRKNRGWLWYFIILAVLTVIATGILVQFNLSQQLTAEKLEAAMSRWKANGPADYVLVYTTKRNNEPDTDHYVVTVKAGKTTEVLVNGSPLAAEQHAYYGMMPLLQQIERFLECDAERGKPRVFTVGRFDSQTGALISYVRSASLRERVEIVVQSLRTKE